MSRFKRLFKSRSANPPPETNSAANGGSSHGYYNNGGPSNGSNGGPSYGHSNGNASYGNDSKKDYPPPSYPPPTHVNHSAPRGFEPGSSWNAPTQNHDYPHEQSNVGSGNPGPQQQSYIQSNNPFAQDMQQGNGYASPSFPPPQQQQSCQQNGDYDPPSFPPPQKQQYPQQDQPPEYPQQDYPPPDHPPPTFAPLDDDTHPDDLPPPTFHTLYLTSPTSNAPEHLADEGWAFTDHNPLFPPSQYHPRDLDAILSGHLSLAPPPPMFKGMTVLKSPGRVNVATGSACPDTCLMSALPLYAAGYHHPYNTQRPKTAYFEVFIDKMPHNTAIAIGFVAVPYPGFRLPGWNRGSIGVHGDDGRRYANDSFGGKDFVKPFREGDTVGIGMTWAREGIEIFFTRNGNKEGAWRLDEMLDAKEENDPKPGLDGSNDVYAAVGVYGGGVKCQVRFLEDLEARR